MSIARNMARGLKGVENVYTQHQHLLFQTMENINKGRLREVDYPFVGNHFQQGRPVEVVIFIVGGTTYEEPRTVALYNATNSGTRFILGGSAALNSKREGESQLNSYKYSYPLELRKARISEGINALRNSVPCSETSDKNGRSHLGILDCNRGSFLLLEVPFTDICNIVFAPCCLYIEGAFATHLLSVAKIEDRNEVVAVYPLNAEFTRPLWVFWHQFL